MLPITPAMLAAAYDFLRSTPPFRRWRLPPADEVQFHVTREPFKFGTHEFDGQEHIIGISERRVGHTYTLFITMAHEMIHAYQAISKTETKGAEHNAAFRRIARCVCRYHGFDPREFV